jgi:hypothetical protein
MSSRISRVGSGRPLRSRCARVLGGLALSGVAVALGSGFATAHDASFRTSVTIHFYDAAAPGAGDSKCDDPSQHDDCFYGRVSSKPAACEADRVVRVFDRNPTPPMRAQAGATVEPELIGETTSDADGRWIVVVDNPGTHKFFAKVPALTISKPGHTHVCRRTVSDDLKVKSDFG